MMEYDRSFKLQMLVVTSQHKHIHFFLFLYSSFRVLQDVVRYLFWRIWCIGCHEVVEGRLSVETIFT